MRSTTAHAAMRRQGTGRREAGRIRFQPLQTQAVRADRPLTPGIDRSHRRGLDLAMRSRGDRSSPPARLPTVEGHPCRRGNARAKARAVTLFCRLLGLVLCYTRARRPRHLALTLKPLKVANENSD